ncbi:MAG: ester cyclase [Thermoplasmata archaeon]|nr:ester cyclase [Thermoplasmata archaeon]
MTQLTEQEARQMIAVVNTRNVDQIVEQYSETATFQVPNLETPLHGKAAIRGFLTGSFTAFPDWTMDVSRVYVTGNDVVVLNSVRGTHTGPLAVPNGQPIAPTNKKFVQEQMTRVVLDASGKVQSLRSYGNPAELTQQLGLPR